ncbi:hypothetical protein REPUB_Repub04eG0221700 [Reevesia pubescens]
MRHKGIACYESCVVCGNSYENGYHIFLACQLSLNVWNQLSLWVEQFLAEWCSFSDFWLNFFIKVVQVKQLDLVFLILWSLWLNWNKCQYENTCWIASKIVFKIRRTISDLESMKKHDNCLASSRSVRDFSPPDAHLVKIIIDASFMPSTCLSGLGFVVRNEAGVVLLQGCSNIGSVKDPLHAGIYAIMFGLQSAISHGYRSMVVETDSSTAFSEILKGD